MKKKIFIIIGIFILTLFGAGITYSFFHSSTSLNTNDQNIAKLIFNTASLDELNISLENFNPGDSREYTFSVSNTFEDKTSDVTVEYQLTIKTYHFMPLVIKLYSVTESEEEILNCDETFSRNEFNELVCNSPLRTIAYDKETPDDYKIKIDFPSEYSGEEYTNLVDFIDVEVRSYQKIN